MSYRVKEEALLENPQLFSQVKGKRVSLHGQAEKVKVQPHANIAAREVVVPAATQADLKFLFEQGNPLIEFVEDEKPLKAEGAKA